MGFGSSAFSGGRFSHGTAESEFGAFGRVRFGLLPSGDLRLAANAGLGGRAKGGEANASRFEPLLELRPVLA